NPGRTGRRGLLDLASMQVRVENPLIAGFFRELGLFSGSGQGMALLASRGREYFGTDILAFDREIFKIFAPFPVETPVNGAAASATNGVHHGAHASLTGTMQVLPTGGMRPGDPVSLLLDSAGETPPPPPNRMSGGGSDALHGLPTDWRSEMHRVALEEDHARWADAQAESSSTNGPFGQNDGTDGRPMQDGQALHVVAPEPGKAEAHRERVSRILAFCRTPRNREEIQAHIGLNNRDYFRKEILVPL